MESMIKLIKYILHKVEVRHLPMKYLTTLDIADMIPVSIWAKMEMRARTEKKPAHLQKDDLTAQNKP